MFHNTTTIRHTHSPQTSFFKEKRLAYGVLDRIKGMAETVITKTGKVGKFLYTASAPIRWTLFPISYTLGLGWKAAKWTAPKIEWGARYGKEVGLGIGKDAIVGSIWEIAKAPLYFAKKNLIDNTRDIMKGVFTTPLNILRIPKNLWSGIKESISSTRTGIKEVYDHTRNLSPLKAINSTRKAIWNTLTAPIVSPLAPVFETPKKVISNIWSSLMDYPKQLWESPKKVRDGVARALNAHNTATSEMSAKQEVPAMAAA